jgi:tetratricopeptide (TPR) repeat protein
MKIPLAAASLLLTLSFYQCRQTDSSPEQLGVVDFAVTGNSEAQPYFHKGLQLLHSFEFDDAAQAFQKAKELDPEFTMAYGGEAMTHNYPLWRYQDKESADSVLQLLAPTETERISKAQTEIEKDFLKAVHVLYGEGSKSRRDSNYAEFLGELYEKYPDNNEVATFYGIALLGSVPVGRDVATYERAAEIAQEVLARNPDHPGALHYLIHAYDDPDHAHDALDAADAYARIAPDAGHALHMPSHIYLAAGLWDKVVSSNEAAWAAGEKRVKSKGLDNDDLNYHALHWLQYAYLQQNRPDDARRLIDTMQLYCDTLASKRARGHLTYLKSTYLVETNAYNSPVSALEVDVKDLNIVTRAMYAFTDGMKYYHQGDKHNMDSVIVTLNAEILRDEEGMSGSNVRMCSGVSSQKANALDIQQSQVMLYELKGMHAWLNKDLVSADKFLQQAASLETSISYAYGPPNIVKPAPELYGEWLLATGKKEEALAQFDLTLQMQPKRLLAMQGKTKATSEL